jgi:hypothetical protein
MVNRQTIVNRRRDDRTLIGEGAGFKIPPSLRMNSIGAQQLLQ